MALSHEMVLTPMVYDHLFSHVGVRQKQFAAVTMCQSRALCGAMRGLVGYSIHVSRIVDRAPMNDLPLKEAKRSRVQVLSLRFRDVEAGCLRELIGTHRT